MTMATPTLAYLCVTCFFLGVLIVTTNVSSQSYTFENKDYFLIKQRKTYDDAVTFCKLRGECLIAIKSHAEQYFVLSKIVKPSQQYIWLGASNEIGTKNFKWLSDGSDVTTQFSNWWRSEPKKDVNKRNAIEMSFERGVWFDVAVSCNETRNVVCERVKPLSSESKLAEHTDLSNAKFKQLEIQANDMATELKFQTTHCSQLVAKLNRELILYRQQNDLLEMRLNRIEHIMSTNRVENVNKMD